MELGLWFKVCFNTIIMGSLHEDQQTILITPRSILLRTRNVSAKVAEKIKTRFMFSDFFFKSPGNVPLNRMLGVVMQGVPGGMC
jgi:hypothetical protein